MAVEKFADVASCQLTSNVTTTPTVGTVETWNVGSLVNLPTLATGDQFRAVVLPTGGDANPEIIIVTAHTSSTLTVQRGEGSNGVVKTHSSGDTVSLIIAAAQMVQMVSGTLSAVNYSSGIATLVLPDGSVAAVMPSTASTDPNMLVGATVGALVGPNGPYILGAATTRPKPSGRMWLNFAFLVNHATTTQVSGFTNDWLSGGMTLPTGDSLVAPIAGKYRASFAGAFIGGAGLSNAVQVNLTAGAGAPVVRAGGAVESGGIIGGGSMDDLLALNAGDHVGLQVWQNSGGTQTLVHNPTATFVSLEWVAWI